MKRVFFSILAVCCLMVSIGHAQFGLLSDQQVFCRFEHLSEVSYGIVTDGKYVQAIDGEPWDYSEVVGPALAISEVSFLHPTEPQKILGIAGSYKEAWEDSEPFKTVRWFSKPPTAAISPGDDVYLPAALDTLKVETEFVIVIGKTIKDGTMDEAEDAIFGYTIGNDIVGDVDSYHRVNEEPMDQEETMLGFNLKMGDGFAPFGPFIYTGVDWKDRDRKLVVSNPDTGKYEVYEHNTSSMIWPPEQIVRDLSRVYVLHPGDIIFSGTTQALPAQAGDIMYVTVEGFGTIVNQVKATP